LKITLRAFRHRNFSLFMSGQICALIGYWMQNVAQSWLLYRLSGSVTLLGVLGFASSVPILLLAPFAGLWSDRFNLHRMMFAAQILEMLQAAALALAGIITFLMIRVVPSRRPASHPPMWHDLREGIAYIWRSVPIRLLTYASLAAGALAGLIGDTLFIGGAVCAAGALYLAYKRPQIRAHIRPIYTRLGIIREAS